MAEILLVEVNEMNFDMLSRRPLRKMAAQLSGWPDPIGGAAAPGPLRPALR